MGKTYKEQTKYDYQHDNKPISRKDYSKMKKKWVKDNFGNKNKKYE